ncbi:MAG: DUF3810 domain-containing protein [Lachnospiraceae bacterium]|nr:DUF3810 domain-containing protein [Lachnospiraceae bacterium]
MKIGKRVQKSGAVYLGFGVLTIGLNAAAWNSAAFSDWYIAHVFPIWVNAYGRITGLFPFSVGEFLLGAGIGLVAAALLLGAVWLGIGAVKMIRFILRVTGRKRKNFIREGEASKKEPVSGGEASEEEASKRDSVLEDEALESAWGPQIESASEGETRDRASAPEGETLKTAAAEGGPAVSISRKRSRFAGFTAGFCRFFAWTVLAVCLIMTLNCFILYHASTFSEHYFGRDDGEYTLEELITVYNMTVERCNYLAGVIARDEDGTAVYEGSLGADGEILDMADMARELMKRLGEKYPQLDGYYPRPKALLSSDFMCQQYMQGYYFPFSMEANYNDVMYILNIPSTMCHELAHLRGYIYEDEANFIGYLACVESEDAFFQYAGYLSVLTYLNNDLYKAWKETPEAYEKAAAAVPPVAVDNQVWTDNIFVTEEEWDRINGKALIDTETVDKAADVFIDMNLKINGVADGKISYSRVVRLLLQYYRLKAE